MFLSPRFLISGRGSVARTAEALRALRASEHAFVVTDPFMVSSGMVERLLAPLADAGVRTTVFDKTVPDPTVEVVEHGAAALARSGASAIVGFGGGSPLDTAKAINVLARGGGRIADYKVPHVVDAGLLPLVAVPTTAGTGSEMTRAIVITNEATSEKMLLMGPGGQPDAAVVDAELTHGCPLRLTADTGIDAFVHALEAYVSKKRNAYSDVLALEAMRLIAGSLRAACFEPQRADARDAMMTASAMAGWAFANASVCLVHGMSRPVGAHFHVAHGLSNAMLLPTVTAFSLAGDYERYAHAARAARIARADAGDAAACDALLEWMYETNAVLGVPSPGAYGIDKGRWHALAPTMAEQALASGSPSNNPVVPSVDELVELYAKVWADGEAAEKRAQHAA